MIMIDICGTVHWEQLMSLRNSHLPAFVQQSTHLELNPTRFLNVMNRMAYVNTSLLTLLSH